MSYFKYEASWSKVNFLAFQRLQYEVWSIHMTPRQNTYMMGIKLEILCIQKQPWQLNKLEEYVSFLPQLEHGKITRTRERETHAPNETFSENPFKFRIDKSKLDCVSNIKLIGNFFPFLLHQPIYLPSVHATTRFRGQRL